VSGIDPARELTHDEVVEMGGAFVLGALGPADAAAVRSHLSTCTEDHSEIAELGGVLPVLAESVPIVEPPAGLKARIMAAAAAEAVLLLALIWVVFQGYAAFTLVRLWVTHRATLPLYNLGEAIGVVASLAVAIRAHRHLGRPEPRPFVAGHWRLGQLYKNADDPALFVPTRDGRRWTLNFGRPVAGALLGLILALGVLAPTLLIALALR